jgi:two-component system CheB/CheR fusion protein
VNLLGAMQVALVIVGADLRVRRFTTMAERLFNLLPSDVGRPIGNLNPTFRCPDLVALIRHTVDAVEVQERETKDDEGSWYTLRIRPYKDLDNRIDGAVLTLIDITDLRTAAVEANAARDYAQGIVETVREPLVVLDEQLRVRSANRSFFETFRVTPSETVGVHLYELGNGQWNIPRLRVLLDEILPQRKRIEDYDVEHDFPAIGRRTMRLNARRIQPKVGGAATTILLAIEDRTAPPTDEA